VEGILRQSADVEEVDRRVHDYEQGIKVLIFSLLLITLEEFSSSIVLNV